VAHHRVTPLAVAAVALVASGCACMYGACGKREDVLEYDGQRCSGLAGSSRNWHQLGYEGAKLHRMADGKDYYVTCFTYRGEKGAVLSVLVESDAFEPEIYVRHEGRNKTTLAAARGDRSARVSVTFPESGNYGVVVTSRRPGDTGRFDLRYSTSSR
jgi:hypothetical protein